MEDNLVVINEKLMEITDPYYNQELKEDEKLVEIDSYTREKIKGFPTSFKYDEDGEIEVILKHNKYGRISLEDRVSGLEQTLLKLMMEKTLE